MMVFRRVRTASQVAIPLSIICYYPMCRTPSPSYKNRQIHSRKQRDTSSGDKCRFAKQLAFLCGFNPVDVDSDGKLLLRRILYHSINARSDSSDDK